MSKVTVQYLRDVDGIGSMHPCAKGDDGAVAYIPAAQLTTTIVNSFEGGPPWMIKLIYETHAEYSDAFDVIQAAFEERLHA